MLSTTPTYTYCLGAVVLTLDGLAEYSYDSLSRVDTDFEGNGLVTWVSKAQHLGDFVGERT